MSACLNCRTLVQLLKKEISQMIDREQNLLRMNAVLTEALNHEKSDLWEEETHWRIKYESAINENLELMKKYAELDHYVKLYAKTDSQPYSNQVTAFKNSQSNHSSNTRSKSITRMEQYIKRNSEIETQQRKLFDNGTLKKGITRENSRKVLKIVQNRESNLIKEPLKLNADRNIKTNKQSSFF